MIVEESPTAFSHSDHRHKVTIVVLSVVEDTACDGVSSIGQCQLKVNLHWTFILVASCSESLQEEDQYVGQLTKGRLLLGALPFLASSASWSTVTDDYLKIKKMIIC